MARVTTAEVKAIMDNCTVADATITAMIGAATETITKVFEQDTTLTTSEKKEIERWFVAHMLASTLHRSTSEEKVGDASAKYTGKFGMGLESTPYGQMCISLDRTGRLLNAGRRGASIYAVES